MANLSARVLSDKDWAADDALRLLVGTEDAADLAGSTPSGGTAVQEQPAWPGDGATRSASGGGYGWGEGEWGMGWFGVNEHPRALLEHSYSPADKCSVLPIGVVSVDVSGNVSPVVETLVQLRDIPVGARDLEIEATENTNEARLTWTESTDV